MLFVGQKLSRFVYFYSLFGESSLNLHLNNFVHETVGLFKMLKICYHQMNMQTSCAYIDELIPRLNGEFIPDDSWRYAVLLRCI